MAVRAGHGEMNSQKVAFDGVVLPLFPCVAVGHRILNCLETSTSGQQVRGFEIERDQQTGIRPDCGGRRRSVPIVRQYLIIDDSVHLRQ